MRKYYILVYFCLVFSIEQKAQLVNPEQQVKNLSALGKLYTYAKFFNPAAEAYDFNFEDWAAYTSSKVINAPNDDSLLLLLKKATLPIMPGLLLSKGNFVPEYPQSNLYFNDKVKGKVKSSYWQHKGVGLGNNNYTYSSILVNGKNKPSLKTDPDNFIAICRRLEIAAVSTDSFVFEANVKIESSKMRAYLWVRIEDPTTHNILFFENMSSDPITDTSWQKYSIKGTFKADSVVMYLGIYTIDGGAVLVDDLLLTSKSLSKESKPLWFYNFNQDAKGEFPYKFTKGIGAGNNGKEGEVEIILGDKDKVKYLRLSSKKLSTQGKSPNQLFKDKPNDLHIEKAELAPSLWAQWPLSVYEMNGVTMPIGFGAIDLKEEMFEASERGDVWSRLSGLYVLYAVGLHFYPYPEVVKDWNAGLEIAISQTLQCKSELAYFSILELMASRLNDSHGYLAKNRKVLTGNYYPEISWEWVEGKLLITHSMSKDKSGLNSGDEVLSIAGIAPRYLYDSLMQYALGATDAYKERRLNFRTMSGEGNTLLELKIRKQDGSEITTTVNRTVSYQNYYKMFLSPKSILPLDSSIWYVNLTVADWPTIKAALPKLKTAKAIIFDLRGYPNGNHQILQHLLTGKDTAKWMHIPLYLYPGGEPVKQLDFGWEMKPLKPHLNAKIVFLINEDAISYSESILGYVEGYKLGTLIGTPTAASNGNVNIIRMPGGYSLSFTGMKVTKLNGKTHHGVGVTPDIIVKKTAIGVRNQKDEVLEKAIEFLKQ